MQLLGTCPHRSAEVRRKSASSSLTPRTPPIRFGPESFNYDPEDSATGGFPLVYHAPGILRRSMALRASVRVRRAHFAAPRHRGAPAPPQGALAAGRGAALPCLRPARPGLPVHAAHEAPAAVTRGPGSFRGARRLARDCACRSVYTDSGEPPRRGDGTWMRTPASRQEAHWPAGAPSWGKLRARTFRFPRPAASELPPCDKNRKKSTAEGTRTAATRNLKPFEGRDGRYRGTTGCREPQRPRKQNGRSQLVPSRCLLCRQLLLVAAGSMGTQHQHSVVVRGRPPSPWRPNKRPRLGSY